MTRNKIISCLLKMSFFLIKFLASFFNILSFKYKTMFVNRDYLETTKDGWNAIIIMIYAHYHRFCENASLHAHLHDTFGAIRVYIRSKHYAKITAELQNRRVRGKVSSFVYENKIQSTRNRGREREREENLSVESNFIVRYYLACFVAILTLLRRCDVIQLFLNNIRVVPENHNIAFHC